MEIVRIFDDLEEHQSLLWAVIYNGEENNEFDRLSEQWSDTQWLEDFFVTNKDRLDSDFWKPMSIEEAVLKASEEADSFDEMTYELAHGNAWGDYENITDIFKQLSRQDFDSGNKGKYKAKPEVKKPFLRFYAVALKDNTYVITGGAIKMVEKMQEDDNLKKELRKMEQVKTFLKENNIEYLDDLIIDY